MEHGLWTIDNEWWNIDDGWSKLDDGRCRTGGGCKQNMVPNGFAIGVQVSPWPWPWTMDEGWWNMEHGWMVLILVEHGWKNAGWWILDDGWCMDEWCTMGGGWWIMNGAQWMMTDGWCNMDDRNCSWNMDDGGWWMGDRRAGKSNGYESTDKPRLAPEMMEIDSGRMIRPSYCFSHALSCFSEKITHQC